MTDVPLLPEACRVLVIDRDSVRRGLLKVSLAEHYPELILCRSVEEGLDRLRDAKPHVVLVARDSVPPDICDRIRAHEAGLAAYIVMMSERPDDDAPACGGGEGADDILPFPFNAEQLDACIEELLERSNPRLVLAELSEAEREATPVSPRDATPPLGLRPRLVEDSWQAVAEEVSQLHDALDELNNYELLRVPRSATASQIKEAFFQCAVQFHPDRFNRLGDDALKEQIYEIYKRMVEAFRVLHDPLLRRTYDDLIQDQD